LEIEPKNMERSPMSFTRTFDNIDINIQEKEKKLEVTIEIANIANHKGLQM